MVKSQIPLDLNSLCMNVYVEFRKQMPKVSIVFIVNMYRTLSIVEQVKIVR